ncbi:glycosyltransferase family 4 protein [Erythrobacter sp.]|uniref:glycosyltransferase family 4 protein n=1 Tax=Erythrobacter sp. TaxID=1042 RepID=UPI003C74ADBE
MRTCLIVNSLTTGGAEVLVCALAAEFARAGDWVLVIALCDAPSFGNSAETEERMARQLAVEGAEFASLSLSARRNPITGASKLREALRTFAPDVIHAHTVRALPMVALARSGAPVLLTHHNTRLPFPAPMLRLCDAMTRCYVAIGEEVERILKSHVRKPVVRIPNAASRAFPPASPRLLSDERKRILSVGAISGQKNYDLLIEVAGQLRNLVPEEQLPEFRIAGGGAELQRLREKATACGVAGMVEFLGERSDVPDLMRVSDLYLNVSLYEGMPLTLLEAMASGLPIVATDVAGNRELVSDGENGMKAPLGDAHAIARTISNILADDDLYARLSAGSIRKSAEFSIENAASRHRELYASLAGSAATGLRAPPKEVA